MATMVLQTAGAALGGALFGPFGAILGRALGGYAGYAIDQKLFGTERTERGSRLEQVRMMASSDGAPMPKAYGRTRIGGQIIWATRFEEVVSKSKSGGKGSPGVTVEEYSYYANFAVGICEGEISAIGRIWADGNEIDQTKYEIRVYSGTEDQEPDLLIEAKQGVGNAPAYRGTAYVVFERLPLEQFGNRIPQLSFEVIRSVAKLDRQIRAITIFPGATEFGYSPVPVKNQIAPGSGNIVNRHNSVEQTDWTASINELMALCPNLETVALVVSWFGNDLRVGNCLVEPRTETTFNFGGSGWFGGYGWLVSGLNPVNAKPVSSVDGRPAFGGTPSDSAVLAAIADLKARGLKVVLYPFLMMDVPYDNGLTDPYGGLEQAPYPWRGRITCSPAPGQSATADLTPDARQQIEAFAGIVSPSDFSPSATNIAYLGPAEWSYRRMVLHYASLASASNGVDGFLLGSEMVGLTTVRDETGAFPFVEILQNLAADVRAIVGNSTAITYGADWSEYFGYHPQDGSDDLYFHLDPLWAHPAIDAVGIDNYMPLSDWRIAGDPAEAEVASQCEPQYLRSNIEGGEGYDWFYATTQDRLAGERTPITDGLGESWVWRYKDIRSWWSMPHYERVDGVRAPAPTQWIPQSKPVWFTELGCAAVTMGANQPNIFPDPKSSENGIPRFSTAVRSDLVQNRFLAAHFDNWTDPGINPVSSVYGGTMIDVARIFPWAWDARPFPFFPANTQVWSDGENWHTGHWLNGRLGGCPVDELVAAIAQDFGVVIPVDCDGFVDGYVVPGPMSARDALAPIASLFSLQYSEDQGGARIFDRNHAQTALLDTSDLVGDGDKPLTVRSREHENELPSEIRLNHAGIFSGFEAENSYSRRLEGSGENSMRLNVPIVLPRSAAVGAVEAGLREIWVGRQKLAIGLPFRHLALSAGDAISLAEGGSTETWLIDSIEDGDFRRIQMRGLTRFESLPVSASEGSRPAPSQSIIQNFGAPQFIMMNLPLQPESEIPHLYCALYSDPWAKRYALYSSPSNSGFNLRKIATRRATTGILLQPLDPGPEGRWDAANSLHVSTSGGALESKSPLQVLNGENVVAVLASNGEWELIQFADAALQSDGSWIVSALLRAQMGSDEAMRQGALAGATVVFLGDGVESVELSELESGLELNWRAGPADDLVGADSYAALTHAHRPLSKQAFSPVHLSARLLPGGDIMVSWVRRSRISSDSWDPAEIPLGETEELYLVRIFDAADGVVRTETTTQTQFIYQLADQVADLGGQPLVLNVSCAQIASSGLAGTVRKASLSI